MLSAREHESTLSQAKQYERQAQAVASIYNLPIPQLSEAEILPKAKWAAENYMRTAHLWAHKSLTGPGTDRAKCFMEMEDSIEMAQNLETKYKFTLPRPRNDIRTRVKLEIDELMARARKSHSLRRARYYEKMAQNLANRHDEPVPGLSDIDKKLIKKKEVVMGF
jgi:hypothetical protein